MAKFRKKPVEIEAAMFDGTLVGDVVYEQGGVQRVAKGSCPDWFPAVTREVTDRAKALTEVREGEVFAHGDSLFIGTLEGAHEARPGDWIIRGIAGELYPCKPEIFAKTYDRVD